jgi:hypothetical protein
MKKVKFEGKKLSLNKKTIAKLNEGEMSQIQGGLCTNLSTCSAVTCSCTACPSPVGCGTFVTCAPHTQTGC